MPSEAEIQDAEARLRNAMLGGDAEALEALLSVDLVITDEEGRSLARDEAVAEIRSRRLRLDAMEVEDLQIRPLGEVAIAWSRVRMHGTHEGQPVSGHYAVTRVWVWEDGALRVAAEHASAVGY